MREKGTTANLFTSYLLYTSDLLGPILPLLHLLPRLLDLGIQSILPPNSKFNARRKWGRERRAIKVQRKKEDIIFLKRRKKNTNITRTWLT